MLGMSEAQFQVIYDGPALQAGIMSARELSSSLAALDQLFDSADDVLGCGAVTPKFEGSWEL